jgi:hypothetical protein
MHLPADALRDGAHFEGLVNTRREAFTLLEGWYEGRIGSTGQAVARARWIAGLPTDEGDWDWWSLVTQEVDEWCSTIEYRRLMDRLDAAEAACPWM